MASSATSKTVTISDVARVVGLSKTTVSTALSGNGRLSEGTREMVRREAEKLGYEADFFAQGLRRKRNDLIGFFSPDIDLGVSTLKMHTIWRLLDERGYTVPVLAYGNRAGGQFIEQEKLLADLRRQKPRAMICNTSNLQSESAQEELSRYLQEGGIAVCYDWPIEVGADKVLFDRQHNTYIATQRLLQAGHRNIGACFPWHSHSSGTRSAGFQQAMSEAGATIRDDWIFVVDYQMQFELEAVALAERFLALRERPTAMCIVNDHVANTFVTCLARAGVSVPRDLSIVSHDNLPIAEYGTVRLTSVSHPYLQIAQSAVEMLDSRLSGRYDGAPRREIVRGQLFERDSVRFLN